MRATLIHNPNAGNADPADELARQLRDLGFDVVRSIDRSKLDDCVALEADVVVVAGGDGTVGKVARRLARTNVPLAIVPMGTANNVARSLGIELDPKRALANISSARERCVDLGIITGASTGDKELFLEGFGMGVFAYVIGEKEQAAKKKKKLKKAVNLIADELETYEPRRFELEIDGRDQSGAYVLVAVMNMQSFGPVLGLAPDARCDDGELDVVLVGPDERDVLLRHLRRDSDSVGRALKGFDVVRARHVHVRSRDSGGGRWTHADDRPRELHGNIEIDVVDGAVRVLVPRGASG
jgi:diacylglycerol kinase family enzyme